MARAHLVKGADRHRRAAASGAISQRTIASGAEAVQVSTFVECACVITAGLDVAPCAVDGGRATLQIDLELGGNLSELVAPPAQELAGLAQTAGVAVAGG